MNTFRYLTIVAIGTIAISCSTSSSQKKLFEVQAERDSLLLLTQQQDSTKVVIDEYIETLALVMDSIRTQEKILTIEVDEKGRRLNNKDIRQNLTLLADVIHRQRLRIESLEKNMFGDEPDSTNRYSALIKQLYAEIDAKNEQISKMQEELNQKTRLINRLNTRVADLESDVDAISTHAKGQAETIALQEEILIAQDNQLNTGYIKVGTRKELQKAGLLSKGLFNGGRLNPSSIDLSQFEQIDIRLFSEISISGKNIKLLSPHPANSFSIEDKGKGKYVLIIKDPGAFWSVANYIIIQN